VKKIKTTASFKQQRFTAESCFLKSDNAGMLLRTKLHIKRSCSKRKSFWLQIQQQFS